MNIGLVSIWCNRGQATVSRHLRSALEALGHQTFVLARPTRAPAGHEPLLSRDGVWDQPNITTTQRYEITEEEYQNWAQGHQLDAIWFDQNYQFDEIRTLRDQGMKTIGRFVWEQFGESHLAKATLAFDVIYSMTRCEKQRYESWGLESPLVRYGCHPELMRISKHARSENEVRFFFPAAGQRKLTKLTLDAFRQSAPEHARLIVKAHGVRRSVTDDLTEGDHRIEVCDDDLDFGGFHQLMASCHVNLAPSRWEGLGLHLYESLAHSMPTISIDFAPINETIVQNESGLLVPAQPDGLTKSGLTAWTCSQNHLENAIVALCNTATLKRLTLGAAERRDQLSWQNTVADVEALLAATFND